MTAFQQFLIERAMLPLLGIVVLAWLIEEFVIAHWLSLLVAGFVIGGVAWLK
ncbi:hypothetical protein [Thiothrix sp.]|jgi:hypothetical protein|uniref:hypothetical protein n=1 Tax=Thiothrix sp. TaxID=1032 RepID=UPI00257CE4CA|nr:hypothetical protein [Thiothrix sp.]